MSFNKLIGTESNLLIGDANAKNFVKNIKEIAGMNEDFNQVLYTARNCRLAVMVLKAGEWIRLLLQEHHPYQAR